MHLRSGLKRRRVVLAGAGAAVLAATGLRPARADVAWPTKPVTLIVPFVAGGTIDILARIAGEKLADALEQPVVIDNRPGGSGTHGAALAAHANADGYTLVMTTVAHAIAPALSRSLSYDLVHDLDAVALVGTAPDVLVVAPSVRASNAQDLVAYIKAHPGEVNYGSAGPGSAEGSAGTAAGRRAERARVTKTPPAASASSGPSQTSQFTPRSGGCSRTNSPYECSK